MKGKFFSLFRSLTERYVPDRLKDEVRARFAKQLESRTVTYSELMDREGVNTWWYGSANHYEFRAPELYNKLPSEIERLIGEHECHQPFVLEVPNVELFGRHGFKITERGEYVVYNYCRSQQRDAARELAYEMVDAIANGTWPLSGRSESENLPEIETAVPLLHRWATNYSHWTEEWLAQLEGLQYYSNQTGEHPTIIIPPDPPSFIPESLETLGYNEEDYVEWDQRRARINRLVLPSIRRCQSGTSDDYIRDPAGLRWVRDNVLDNVPPSDEHTSSKILISREEDAQSRRIVNWGEIKRKLSEQGFQTYVLSDIDFVKQKQIFSEAEIIVGTHGAGLTELIYATDAAVIELFGDYFVPVYYEMAQGVGLRYGCLKCKSVGDDIRVNVEELIDAVNTVKLESKDTD